MSSAHEEDDDRVYQVVRNDEDQYSVWLAARPLPRGWTRAGFEGRRAECLAHVAAVWTDMRPRSLREALSRDGVTDPR